MTQEQLNSLMEDFLNDARKITAKAQEQALRDLICFGSWKAAINYLSPEDLRILGHIRSCTLEAMNSLDEPNTVEG